MTDYAKDVLVDTQWVENHLSDTSIRIVEVDENPALYSGGAHPGRDRLRLEDGTSRTRSSATSSTRREFGELLGSRGISNEHTVVLYGDRNNWFAAYTYWYLKYYGHDDVKLMNGPREKWISEGRPTSTDVPRYDSQTFSAEEGDEAIRAYRDEVLGALDSATRLVDVRSPQEFSGELIAMAGYEQEGAQRAGHIPGAASVPWAQAVKEDGTFKTRRRAARALHRQGRDRRPPDHRLLPDRRALGAHLVRAARAARRGRRQELRRLLDRVGQHGRRPNREGRLENRGESLEERLHDPAGRTPHEVPVDRVGRRLDRHALADQALHLMARD